MPYRSTTRFILGCSAFAVIAAAWLGTAAPVAPDGGPDGTTLPARADDNSHLPRYRVQSNGYLRATVTNWGYFGNRNRALVDSSTLDRDQPLPAPTFESPPYSQINYQYEAGLWVGGIVNGDTLVSVGSTTWPPTFEIHSDTGSPPVFSEVLGDEEYTSVMFDTLTDPTIVRPDNIDGPHRPLPIEIRQITRTVRDPVFNKGMIVEVVVRNIGAGTIHDLWLGWYIDCDIGHPNNDDSWLGDLSGFRTSAITLNGSTFNIHAAWSADNDGDPDSVSGLYNAYSPRAVFGSMFLESTPSLPRESFNWWNVGFNHAYDWGPSRNPADTNINGGYGRVLGDAMKYRRMSNEEIDYEQVYAAVDRSDSGWIPPTDAVIAEDFADGWDTRFLHTRGAVDLLPGDSVTAVWAWVIAPGFHTDPDHFALTFDAHAPDAYLSGLNFTPLDTALARMSMLWTGNFADALIGAPRGFAITGWDDSTAAMKWLPRRTPRLTHYNIYRSLDPAIFNKPPVAVLAPTDSVYTETGLPRSLTYYYTIRSVDPFNRAGPPSNVIDVLPDRPMTPVPSGVRRGDARILLEWAPPLEPDVVSHRVYRRLAGADWAFTGETFLPGSYRDATVANATVYEYRITAVSALGSESFATQPLPGIAFSFSGPPLVIDYTLSGATSLTDKDSVAAVWQRLTAPLNALYYNADPLTVLPFGLDVYDPHPATISVTDGREGLHPETGEQLDLYEYAGGISILCGRDLFNDEVITEGTKTFGPGDREYDNYGITAAYYPRVLLSHPTRPNAEFVAARSVDPSFPDLAVDSTRTDWGLNPALPKPGNAVPFVGFLEIDTARAQVVYRFVSRDGATSPSDGRAVGIVSTVPGVHAAVLTFPLSYMEEGAVQSLLPSLLRRLGWVGDLAGDLNGDGVVMVDDLSIMIDLLFRGIPVTNRNNADVNGDCRTDLIDVVTLIDYLFFGRAPLSAGCVNP